MTIFMTFSIYSLRVSSDMPTQSQYLPMVTLYFLLGITYTFMAYMWFILANEYQTKGKMPQVLVSFAPYVKRTLFWIFNADPWWKKRKYIAPNNTVNNLVFEIKIPQTSATSNAKNAESNQGEAEEIFTQPKKCHNCDFCGKCLANKEQEKETKSNKQLFESNLSAINYFAFFVLFLIMLGCNLFVWLMVSNPP